MAPSGVLTVGVALVLRDVVQRCLGLRCGLIAIAARHRAVGARGAGVAGAGVRRRLRAERTGRLRGLHAVAAAAADCWQLSHRRWSGWWWTSIVFLSLAFGSLEFLPGQIVGKAWAVLIAIPLVRLVRRVAPTPA